MLHAKGNLGRAAGGRFPDDGHIITPWLIAPLFNQTMSDARQIVIDEPGPLTASIVIIVECQ